MAASKTALFVRQQVGGMLSVVDETATTGDIFFVDSGSSTNGDSAGYGANPDKPFATIDHAVSQCAANNGDRIYVMPGHTETVVEAGGITFDKAGIEVIGMGVGTSRPTITLDTLVTSTVIASAADTVLRNLRFVSGINDLALMLSLAANNQQVHDCEFVSVSAKECWCHIAITTTKDNFLIKGCTFLSPTDPEGTTNDATTGAIFLIDSEDVRIEDCYFSGNFESYLIHNRATACTNLWIRDCYGENALTDGEILAVVSTGTGGMSRCQWTVPTAADITTASLFVVIGATSPFGMHDTTFMNDHAGGENLALPVVVATT